MPRSTRNDALACIVAVTVVTIALLALTGHRHYSNAPVTAPPPSPPATSPVRAALTGLGLLPDDTPPLENTPASTPEPLQGSTELSPATASFRSTATTGNTPQGATLTIQPPLSCPVSILGATLGLITSLLSGHAC
jgi:hypothetical protein